MLLLITAFLQIAQATDLKSVKKTVKSILKPYSQAVAINFKVEKKEIKKTLGTESVEQLDAIYSQNKLVLTKKNPLTEIIYNKNIWIIENPDLDLDPSAKRKVTVFKNIKSEVIQKMTSLFSKPDQLLQAIDAFEQKDNILMISLKNKNEGFKKLQVEFNTTTKQMTKITFIDDIETETTLLISDVKFLKSAPKGVFKYTPKKGDEVVTQ